MSGPRCPIQRIQQARVDELIRQQLGEILTTKVRDPRVGFVTVTDTETSPDLRHARVYFNVLGAAGRHDEAAAGLKSASGFIRTKAAKQLNLRFAPSIEFTYDESADEAQRIDALLKQVKT